MPAIANPTPTIECLQHMTSRLASADVTAAEANTLRLLILRLLDELGRSAKAVPGEATPSMRLGG